MPYDVDVQIDPAITPEISPAEMRAIVEEALRSLEQPDDVADLLPAVPEQRAGTDERGVPHEAADRGADREGQRGHAPEPGGDRHHRPDERHAAPDEHRGGRPPVEPRLGLGEVLGADVFF